MNAVALYQFLAGVFAGGAWYSLVYFGKADPGSFVSTLQLLLGALIAHLINKSALGTEPAPTAEKPPVVAPKEGGYIRWGMLALLLLLSACATGYRVALDSGLAQARAADDNLVLTYKAAICALPLSAILRNADIIPGIKALCLPGGNMSDPNGILPTGPSGPVQVQIVQPPANAVSK